MTPEELDDVRDGLTRALGSPAEHLTAKHLEILAKNLCTCPTALEDIELDTLRGEPDPVPKVLLDLIKGFKKRRAEDLEEQNAEAEKQKVEPDISSRVLKQLMQGVPAILPIVDELKAFLVCYNQPVPVNQRIYDKLSLVAGADELVCVCSEQQDAEIVTTFSTRIHESIRTTGGEELTAYGVTKMVFDVLAQIDERIEAPLKLDLVYDRNSTTKGTWSVPNAASTRPDGTGVADYTLLLAGEEKAEDGTLAQAKADLKLKFREPLSRIYYGSLDYIIAYAACGKSVQFYAIRILTAELVPVTEVVNFTNAHGRARLLLLVINLYRLLLKMKEILPNEHLGLQMFKKKERPNRVTVEAGLNSVTKTIEDAVEYFKIAGTTPQYVKEAYAAAKATDYVAHAVEGPTLRADVYKVVIKPLGCTPIVRDEENLRRLTHDVIHGLAHLHSKDICHRDIQDANIIAYIGPTDYIIKYMVIDLESAAPSCAPLPPVHFEAWDDDTLVAGRYVSESDLHQLAKTLRQLVRQAAIVLSEKAQHFVRELNSKSRSASSLLGEEWLACKCAQGIAIP